jgi:hypothetical protein
MKIKAVKEVVNLTLQESQYDRQLEELRTWVGDLCDMLSTRGSSLAQDPVNKVKQTLPLPSSVNAINKASKQLGTGLEKAWTCLNTNHGGHDAVLRFDAQLDMEDDVHMNVAISCRSSNSRTPQAYGFIPIFDKPCLQVQTPRRICLAPRQKRSAHCSGPRAT